MASVTATHTAPAFLRGFDRTRWRVRALGKARGGNVLVLWIDGPLAGREARLAVRTLEGIR